MFRPSTLGAIPQTSGATSRTPGTFLSSGPSFAGRVLKTGLGEFSRRTISPSTWLRVSPTMFRRPAREAEQPHDPEDRDRQADQRQRGADRPGQQVPPGESSHASVPNPSWYDL